MSNVIWVLQRRGRDPSWETVPGSPTFATKEAAEKAIVENWPLESGYVGSEKALIRAVHVEARLVEHEVTRCRECPYARPLGWSGENGLGCRHPSRGTFDLAVNRREMSLAQPPPSWCPLREAPVLVKLKVTP